ncbi:DUF551 domain-containing protein [Enterobacter chengduensis]|uniref:DUF551 domain-containing protein n=1 Tax=Enterobacter chengduensis TaxID=2494701 RepID=UPI0020047BA4|nr:DUF551 domain-containing protein [Enterobacter chengduensis]MCK7169398.1 DUF551 domain-containing protein [Enterobacter chengduensis]MCM8030783.1 DUF551 domain-containing protein [Enterobacter chengduensis]
MSTITREQLHERAREKVKSLEFSITQTAFADSRAELEEELELARIALASLEAEPAGCDACGGNGSVDIDHGEMGIEHIECPKCYTAPPAPVDVPDDVSGPLAHAYKELTPTFMRNHIDVFERYGIYPDGSAGIQAMRIALDGMNRRAAMLQGAEPVSNRDELPDGWVACSERMPNIGVPVSVPVITSCGDVVHCAVYVWDGKEWQDWYEEYDKLPFSTFTHWMPLPAAPQQE